MSHHHDPTQSAAQAEADRLALEAHAIIETLRRRRLSVKLLKSALYGLQVTAGYKNRQTWEGRSPPPPPPAA